MSTSTHPQKEHNGPPRLRPLDGMRALAILIVMVSHAGLGNIVPGGFGVTVFFFLSGYLITTLMVGEWDNSERINLRGFYFRRAVRILPPMLIAILAAVSLAALGVGRAINNGGLVWDFLFLSNYAASLGVGSNVPIPLWSLAVEEHFYLLFPFIFIGVRRRARTHTVAFTCAALCIVVLLVRMAHAELGAADDTYYWSHTRVDSILFGCILATWNNPVGVGRTYIGAGVGYAILGAGLILLSFAIRDPIFRATWRYTMQGVALFLIFNYALRSVGAVAWVLSSAPLRVVADLSYFLYLIHFPLLEAAERLPLSTITQHVLALAAAFLLAMLVRHFIELPLLRWRKSITAQGGVKVSTV